MTQKPCGETETPANDNRFTTEVVSLPRFLALNGMRDGLCGAVGAHPKTNIQQEIHREKRKRLWVVRVIMWLKLCDSSQSLDEM
mmetsp:Transcript_11091/g.18829  ORF Transcript_11091/g.18829 Transcript_11091/m.18829 type:complete len:84 (+) Transcript_11091:729-980(+)